MAKPLPSELKTLIFGFSLGLMTLCGGGIWAKSVLFPVPLKQCTQRYPVALSFPTPGRDPGGAVKPLTVREIQSKLDFTEWGLIENVSLVGEQDLTVEVALRAGSFGQQTSDKPKGGTSYHWAPGIPGGAVSACLAYEIYLPVDFDFGRGGKLPGVFGGPVKGQGPASDSSLGSQITWRSGGRGDVVAKSPQSRDGVSINTGDWRIPLGRWVHIEQEVVLNHPGYADGFVAVWVDGVLRSKSEGVVWRQRNEERIGGVLADTYYGGETADFAAPKDTFVRLSAFDFRWQ